MTSPSRFQYTPTTGVAQGEGRVVRGGDVVAVDSRCPEEGTGSVESLVLRHGEGLRRMCWSYLHDADLVEDIVQDTFCRLMEAVRRLPDDADLGAWVHRVAANLCIDEVRRRSRRSQTLMDGQIAEIALLGVADDDRSGHPEAALELDVTRKLVRAAILALPPRQRDVLILRDVMGNSEAATAAVLGSSTASVQGLLHRAREAFRHAYMSSAAEDALPVECREATFVFEHLRPASVRKDRLRVLERHLDACTRCRERFCPVANQTRPTFAVNDAA